MMTAGAHQAAQEETTAYLALGSNLGERRANLQRALACLGDLPGVRVTKVSPAYRTAPWGVEDQPEFLNLTAQVRTRLAPLELLSAIKHIERQLGRTDCRRWGPRVIDIDILMYDDCAMESEDLVLPHPHMAERAFVLVPLADIAPDVRLPNGQRVAEAAAVLRQEQGVDADV
jgi:2-amino-4-hydroxy-6-hydroxymethyldihydropteridine diphosphokinase